MNADLITTTNKISTKWAASLLSFLILLGFFLAAIKFGFVLAAVIFLALAVSITIFYGFVRQPILGVGCLITATSLDVVGRVASGTIAALTIFHLIYGVLLLAVFWRILLGNKISWHGTDFDKPLAFFLAVICFSLFYSPAKVEGLFYFLRILALVVLMYLIVNTFHNEKDMRIIVFFTLASTIVLSALGVWSFISAPTMMISEAVAKAKLFARYSVTFENPNYFATLLIMPILLTFSLILNTKMRCVQRIICFGMLILYLTAIVATFSRAAWLSLLVGITVLIFYSRYKVPFLIAGTTLMIIAFVGISTTPYFKTFLIRFGSIFSASQNPADQARIFLALGGIMMGLDTFLLGVGFRGFAEIYPQGYQPNGQILNEIIEAHTLPTEIFAELGILGLVAFGLVVWRLLKNAHISISNLDGYAKAFQTGMIAFTIALLTNFMFTPGGLLKNLMWISFALVAGCIRLAKDHPKEIIEPRDNQN